jgi:DNA-binding beta-propeller fold protein YncE
LVLLLATAGIVSCIGAAAGRRSGSGGVPYRSPFDVTFSPDGKTLAVSDRTAHSLALIAVNSAKVSREVRLDADPTGVAWAADGSKVYVCECEKGTVAEIEAGTEKVIRRFTVGARPTALALAPRRGVLVVANKAANSVSVISLADGKVLARIAVPREPVSVAITGDESLAVVGNLLPSVSSVDPLVSSAVSVIDLETLARVADIRLLVGSTAARGVAVSPDGRWAYVVHTLGHFNLPTTQIERGWISTNALSILDLAGRKPYATVLLDYLSEGAADPWGLVVSKDGKTLWATLAGVHQIARINIGELHALLAGEGDLSRVPLTRSGVPSLWCEIKANPAKRDLLSTDLGALYQADLIERVPVPGKAPRGMALAPDGGHLAIAAYYSGEVFLADAKTGKIASTIPLKPAREPDDVRRGEIIFHDAAYCFQRWLSCATCHPDARVDGLNWDLLNDGIGNPKNTKSLLLSHQTPPVMSLGVRANMGVAAVAGFRFILFREPAPEESSAVQAYLRSLRPEPGPYLLPNGRLSPKAERGKAIFESSKTRCAVCHSGPRFTDLKLYDVGTTDEADPDKGKEFKTPPLVELWRTGPYLHLGQAVALQDVFTTYNKEDRHGVTSHLSKDELDALAEYLLSL